MSIINYLKTFKNVSYSKKNVARTQVKHLLSLSSLDIIWSSFLFLTLNKLLGKHVLVRDSLFHFFWHSFITISKDKLQVTSEEGSHSSKFLQSYRWKWKETSTREFFNLSKRLSPMDVFIILPLSANDFCVKKKGRKTTTLQDTQADQIF